MIEEEPEEEVTGEAMVMEEAEAAGKPAAEAVVDEDTTMQDMPEVALLAEAGLSADATRTSPMEAIEALLGVWSNGTIRGIRAWIPPAKPGGDCLAEPTGDAQVARVVRPLGEAQTDDNLLVGHLGGPGACVECSQCAG